MAKTTMLAGSYTVPHIKNGKVRMVKVRYQPHINTGKIYPFASERQITRYMRQKRKPNEFFEYFNGLIQKGLQGGVS